MNKKLVIAAGMVDSVHFAKWVSDVHTETGKLLILPTSPHRRVHPILREVMWKNDQVRLVFSSPALSIPIFFFDRMFLDILKATMIALLHKRLKPELIHAHQFQYSGYALGLSRYLFGLHGATLVICNWGSELSYFSEKWAHRFRLVMSLRQFDFFHAECQRDELLARGLGFKGHYLAVMPISGGFDRFSESDDDRDYIAVKGYLGRWGKSNKAVKLCSQAIRETGSDLTIIMFSSSFLAATLARKIARKHSTPIKIYRKGKLSTDEMLQLFQSSLAYVSVSSADGIGTTSIEAASQGAFPFQLSTSCLLEWIPLEDGFGAVCNSTTELKGQLVKLLRSRPAEVQRRRKALVSAAKSRLTKSALLERRRHEYRKLLERELN